MTGARLNGASSPCPPVTESDPNPLSFRRQRAQWASMAIDRRWPKARVARSESCQRRRPCRRLQRRVTPGSPPSSTCLPRSRTAAPHRQRQPRRGPRRSTSPESSASNSLTARSASSRPRSQRSFARNASRTTRQGHRPRRKHTARRPQTTNPGEHRSTLDAGYAVRSPTARQTGSSRVSGSARIDRSGDQASHGEAAATPIPAIHNVARSPAVVATIPASMLPTGAVP